MQTLKIYRLVVILLAYAVCGRYAADTYKAAVVEFQYSFDDLERDKGETVLPNYLKLIKDAKQKGADIIVFPELTLNIGSPIIVPDESKMAQPWTDNRLYSKILRELSWAAYNESIYIVVNVEEKDYIKTGNVNGTTYTLFNTNFVLDRKGIVISRYRKINLYGETGRTPSLSKRLGVFQTDFGVKFGHFICFDLLFSKPAIELLRVENVFNIIFPTMWFSEMPFLTAAQIQESWAYTHNVNLLAAGANNPDLGSTGTGIYSGKKGRLVAEMNWKNTTKLYIFDVPVDPRKDDVHFRGSGKKKPTKKTTVVSNTPLSMDKLFLKQQNMESYDSVLLNQSGVYSVRVGEIICSANVQFVPESEINSNEKQHTYRYRLMAFDGIRSHTYTTTGNTDCAVVACSGEDIIHCAKRYPDFNKVYPKNIINSIELHAVFPRPVVNENATTENRAYYPVTLDASIMPISIDDYESKTEPNKEGFVEIIMKIKDVNQMETILFTFGVTGRVFERDGMPIGGSGTIHDFAFMKWFMSIMVSLYYLFFIY